MNNKDCEVLVVGAGALGCYLAGTLMRSGNNVTLLARGEAFKKISSDGIVVEGLHEEWTARPSSIIERAPAEVPPLVIIATKSWQVGEAARALKPGLPDDAKVLTLQNGLEAPLRVAAEVGIARTLCGICRISCVTIAPGRVRHAGIEPSIILGEADASAPPSPSTSVLIDSLARAGFRMEWTPDPSRSLWEKLLFVVAFGTAGSLYEMAIGQIRTQPKSSASMFQMLDEAAAIATASNVAITAEDVARIRKLLMTLPADAQSSMQRDIAEGRPSELNDILGALVRRSEEVGMSAIALTSAYQALLSLEQGARDLPG